MRNVILYARAPEWRELIERAEQLIASPDFRALKAEGRTLAGVIEVPGVGAIFLKRAAVPTWSRGIVERMRGSRASRAIAGAAMLEARGVAHPEPMAAMESYSAGAIRASYIVSRALVNADTVSRFAIGPGGIKARDVRRRKRISDAIALSVRGVHDRGLFTRDLQETNIMIEAAGADGFKVYFIDLEDFRSAASVTWRRRTMNLVHLDRSAGRFMCRAARLDFLYAYLGGRPERKAARRIVAEILALRARIDRRKNRNSVSSKTAAINSVRGSIQ